VSAIGSRKWILVLLLLPAIAAAEAGPAGAATGAEGDSVACLPSPKGALIRSAIYPGWGQLANKKPYKACVIMAVEAYLLGVALSSDRSARDAGRLAREAATGPGAAAFADRRTRYEDRRNSYFWWLGAAILYSMLDAYVDASLAGVPKKGSKAPPVILGARQVDGAFEIGIGARF
jgi:hypothetical protein